jgi:hypothetical protein
MILKLKSNVRFEALPAVKMSAMVFQTVMPLVL